MAAVIKMTETTLDSRVARLESDVSFIRTDVTDIKAGLHQMRDKMDDGFKEVRGEIAELRKETHAELGSVRGEIADLRKETHAELGSVRGEIAGLRGELTRHFRWLAGLMITIALSLFATIITMTHQPVADRNAHVSPIAAVSPPHRPVTRETP